MIKDENKVPIGEEILSPVTIAALKELGEVLLQIHRRMIADDYEIRDGKIYKQGTDILYMPPKYRQYSQVPKKPQIRYI